MAEAGLLLDRNQLNCSVCLDVLKDPVTIPCGHSYCRDCITDYWDQNQNRAAVCPQCRNTFSPRPNLCRNTVLSDLLDRLRTVELQDCTQDQNLDQGQAVRCDVCPGSSSRAVRSCLVCLVSFCELHVRPHLDSTAFQTHRLVEPQVRLQDSLCPRHHRLMDLFCTTDKTCICYLCLTEQHQNHHTVQAQQEQTRLQKQLSDLKEGSLVKIQQKEKDFQELQQTVSILSRSACAVAEESEAMFSDLIRSLELKRFEVRELIRAQEKTIVEQAENLMEKIQEEINELKKNQNKMEELSKINDSVRFIQDCQTLEAAPPLEALPTLCLHDNQFFVAVTTAMTDFKALIQEVMHEGFLSIYQRVRDVTIIDPHSTDESCDAAASGVIQSERTVESATISPLNPFISAGFPTPTFTFSPPGSRLSSGYRHRLSAQRRAHQKRK
ncbi:tripartite motif-containing protein 29-like [Gouania willdenowi]|nr:tripartite motif-containing protein 29-like [Gouania willdenowi]